MTLFWTALWVALSTLIIGVFVWTTHILLLQKKVWAAFARARGLEFEPRKIMESPKISGQIGDVQIQIESEERNRYDIRGRRYVTAVQLQLPFRMPTAAGVASGAYQAYLAGLTARDELVLTYPGWGPGLVMAKTEDLAAAKAYFTPERLRVLDVLIQQKNMSVLYLFDEENVFLRFESPDPMLKPGQLDKMIDKVLSMVKPLAP